MRVSTNELIAVGLVILYIAFATHPPPPHIKDFLSGTVGQIVSLVAILVITVHQSLIVGVFLAIAYVMTVGSVTEYMDVKEQTPPKEEPKQPKASGIPPPAVTGAMASLVKGDVRLPQTSTKKGTSVPKPPVTTEVKPTAKTGTEHFASF